MIDTRPLIVGAGPAGLRAAITLSDAGLHPVLVDYAPGIGGAVYANLRAQPNLTPKLTREARILRQDFDRVRPRVDLRLSTAFAAFDQTGTALLTGQAGMMFKPRAIIFATGARERIQPRPGWTMAGVSSAGALQIALKTTGTLPLGRLLLAGTGPLLYAIAAQMVAADRPPVAVIETGHPLRHPLMALRLPARVLTEAARYMGQLLLAGVPILSGTDLTRIETRNGALIAHTSRQGRWAEIAVDHIGLHDGLARNDFGVSAEMTGQTPVFQAGDCRSVLGRWAAEEDGKRAAEQVLHALNATPGRAAIVPDQRFIKTQTLLAKLFARAPALAAPTLPDDTVICRCENRSLGDLKQALQAASEQTQTTARTLRLTERFGMGPCQGRQCLDWVAALTPDTTSFADLRGNRWPIKPVRVRDILDAPDFTADPSHQDLK